MVSLEAIWGHFGRQSSGHIGGTLGVTLGEIWAVPLMVIWGSLWGLSWASQGVLLGHLSDSRGNFGGQKRELWDHFYTTLWSLLFYCGSLLCYSGFTWGLSRVTLGIVWGHIGDTLGSHWGYSGVTYCVIFGHFGSTLRLFWANFGAHIQGALVSFRMICCNLGN